MDVIDKVHRCKRLRFSYKVATRGLHNSSVSYNSSFYFLDQDGISLLCQQS